MSEQNKMRMRRAINEVWNGENFTAVNELVTSDVVLHLSRPGDEIGALTVALNIMLHSLKKRERQMATTYRNNS